MYFSATSKYMILGSRFIVGELIIETKQLSVSLLISYTCTPNIAVLMSCCIVLHNVMHHG